MRSVIAVLLTLIVIPIGASKAPPTVGFQQVTVADSALGPLPIAIWYPSDASAADQPLDLVRQTVAADGAVRGTRLPLVVISHGTGGSFASHYDVALALARAGYVVVAVMHPGDNYQDQRAAGNRRDLIDRPRHIRSVIDYMVTDWPGRDRLDPGRIGAFGFSLGGFTTLVAIGGTPDLHRLVQLCADRPDAPECAFVAQRHGDQLGLVRGPPPVWVHDARIKAAVVAAPAAGVTFGSAGLRAVTVPVQLWRADDDENAPDAWNSGLVRTGLATPPDEHVVPHAGHFAFAAPCSDALARAAAMLCHDAAGFDRVAFHRQFDSSVVAFFNARL